MANLLYMDGLVQFEFRVEGSYNIGFYSFEYTYIHTVYVQNNIEIHVVI